MQKKGFTLIELLAVLVILSVIGMITIPIIVNQINESKKKAFTISVQNILEAAKTYVVKNYVDNDFPSNGIDITSGILEVKNGNFTSGVILKNDEGIVIAQNVSDGSFCANGPKNKLEVKNGNCSASDDTAADVKLRIRDSSTTSLLYSLIMSDSGSGIKKYSYCYKECNNDSNWNTKTYSEPYEKIQIIEPLRLNNLSPNTSYTIKVKVLNGNGQEKEISANGTTTELEAPKFIISSTGYSGVKKVTIKYPTWQQGYEYSYDYTKNGYITEEGAVPSTTESKNNFTESEVKLDADALGTIIAKIRVNGKTLSSTLNITNIDKNGPDINVTVENPDEWTKTKKVTVTASDSEVGLAFKAYKFDNGDWTNDNTHIYDNSGVYKVQVRDREGNISTKEFSVYKTDSNPPTCNISFSGTSTTYNGKTWYSNPTVTITAFDQYMDNYGHIISDANYISGADNIKITQTQGTSVTNSAVPLNNNSYAYSGSAAFNDGSTLITVTVYDKLGNSGTCSKTVYVDKEDPTCSIDIKGTGYTGSGLIIHNHGGYDYNGYKWYITPNLKATFKDEYTDINGNKVEDDSSKLSATITHKVSGFSDHAAINPSYKTNEKITLNNGLFIYNDATRFKYNKITFKVVDKAGKEGTCESEFYTEKISVPTIDSAVNSYYKGVSSSYTGGSAASGIKKEICYLLGEKTQTDNYSVLQQYDATNSYCHFTLTPPNLQNEEVNIKRCIISNTNVTMCSIVSKGINIASCSNIQDDAKVIVASDCGDLKYCNGQNSTSYKACYGNYGYYSSFDGATLCRSVSVENNGENNPFYVKFSKNETSSAVGRKVYFNANDLCHDL